MSVFCGRKNRQFDDKPRRSPNREADNNYREENSSAENSNQYPPCHEASLPLLGHADQNSGIDHRVVKRKSNLQKHQEHGNEKSLEATKKTKRD